MSNLTDKYRRPYNGTTRAREIFRGLMAGTLSLYQGAIVGKNSSGYFENAASTKGGLRDLAIVSKNADNTLGADGALEVDLERGVHAYDTWTGTAITQKNIGDDVVIGGDNQTIVLWTPGTLPTAVALGDGNSMTLQAVVPGVTYKIVNEGISKPLTFRSDKPGELTISLKTDGAAAIDATMTGTTVTAAVNLSPVAGALVKAAVLGTGNTVLAVTAATTLSAPRLGQIVDVTDTTVYVDSTK